MTDAYPQIESELRARLASDLSLKELPEELWDALVEDNYVFDYMLRKNRKQYLIILKRAHHPDLRRGRPLGAKSGAKSTPKLKPLEELRAKVFSRALGRFAERRQEVVELRKSLFGGAPLSENPAEDMLLQIAPRYLDRAWFVQKRIPIVGHTSYFWNPSGPARGGEPGKELRIEWDGRMTCIKNARRLVRAAANDGVFMNLPQCPLSVFATRASRTGGRQTHTRVHVRCRADLPESLKETYRFMWEPVPVARSSVLGEIQATVLDLTRDYGWHEAASLRFLIEGKVPFVPPLDIKFAVHHSTDHRRLVVSLEFEPCITDESLMGAFRHARRAILENQSPLIRKRRLELFDFVERYRERAMEASWEELGESGTPFPWKEVREAWCEYRPRLKYRTTREFRVAFSKTRRELILPPLTAIWGGTP